MRIAWLLARRFFFRNSIPEIASGIILQMHFHGSSQRNEDSGLQLKNCVKGYYWRDKVVVHGVGRKKQKPSFGGLPSAN